MNSKDFSYLYIIQTAPIPVLEVIMLAVPPSLSKAFEAQLNQRNVPDRQCRNCYKWLRFYLDFCTKYDSKQKLTASFARFDEKLQWKAQHNRQRQQAGRSKKLKARWIFKQKIIGGNEPVCSHWPMSVLWQELAVIRPSPPPNATFS
jgi:hypothetical protein